jgi:hypothetical protein
MAEISTGRMRFLIGTLAGLMALLAAVVIAQDHFAGADACGDPVAGTVTSNHYSESYVGTRLEISATLENGRSVFVSATAVSAVVGRSYQFQQYCFPNGSLTGYVSIAESR